MRACPLSAAEVPSLVAFAVVRAQVACLLRFEQLWKWLRLLALVNF